MIKFIRTTLLAMATLSVMPVAAQQVTKAPLPKVMNRYGKMVDMPVFGSPEANNIVPKRCGTSILENQLAKDGKRRVISSSMNYVPHTGKVTIPVILVNFKDVQFTINSPKTAFDQFFNGTTQTELGNANSYNHGSVAQYFKDMSSNEFTPEFKVYGPVTVDSLMNYYGGKKDDGSDEKPGALIKDAIAKLQASSEKIDDVSQFSTDGKTIDCIYIVYAGLGQNNGGSDSSVWAKTGNLLSTSINGTSIRWYSMAGELGPNTTANDVENGITQGNPMITGVGVTCHELSHALGLPDFYTTNPNAYLNNQEMEYWDLMDGGEYTYEGYCPTAYTAFEKNEMEWHVDIQELSDNKSISMRTSTEQGGTAYKITNPDNDKEYFMLEKIQRLGWNRYQLGNGLLIYHVNRPSDKMNSNDRYNNTPGFPGMAVIPADGACLSSYIDANRANYLRSHHGDLFPGTGNVDTLNVTELSDAKPQPNFCWYNSAKTEKLATNKALRNIKYDTSTGVVSFDYIDDVSTAIRNISIAEKEKTDNRIYTIDGRYVGTDFNTLPHGLYIRGGKKIIK